MLTEGVDSGAEFVGTEKGDLFKVGETLISSGYYDTNADGNPDTWVNQYTSHLNSLDVLDGGAGKDTLNVKMIEWHSMKLYIKGDSTKYFAGILLAAG